MAKTMTPSEPMTDRQIERAIEIFRAQLRWHTSELPSDIVQIVFGQNELGPEWLAVLRKRVEAISRRFSGVVNYDDPRWTEIRKGDYTYVDSDARVTHFPIQGKGQAPVTYGYLMCDHQPTTREVLDQVRRRGDIRHPDRAETESFIDAHQAEKDKYPVIGLYGSVVKLRGLRPVAYVRAYGSYRRLGFRGLGGRWGRRCRFLVVHT